MRRSCVPPPFYRHLLITNYYTYTHINTYICIHLPTPDPSPPSLEPPAWQALILAAGPDGSDCQSWITSPVAKSCVYGVLCALLLRCFSCSHTVLPKEHSLGVIFFPPHIPHVMLYFSSINPVFLSCLPLVIYVVYVWTGWWLISLVLVTSDNKGLLLLLLLHPSHFCKYFIIPFHVTTLKKWHFATM